MSRGERTFFSFVPSYSLWRKKKMYLSFSFTVWLVSLVANSPGLASPACLPAMCVASWLSRGGCRTVAARSIDRPISVHKLIKFFYFTKKGRRRRKRFPISLFVFPPSSFSLFPLVPSRSRGGWRREGDWQILASNWLIQCKQASEH